jgi:hypothetical protein
MDMERINKMDEEDFEFDFGFTSEDELKAGELELQDQLGNTQVKLEGLRKMIMPLLLNLKKNPDKDIIKWNGADRVKNIDAFIKKMDAYIKS